MGIFRSLFLVLTTNLDLDNISLKGHVGGGGATLGRGCLPLILIVIEFQAGLVTFWLFKKKSHHKIITQENSLFIIIWSIFTLLNSHKHLHSLKFQIVFFNVMSINFSNSCTVYIIFEFVFINMWILYGIYKSWIHIKIHMHNWCKQKYWILQRLPCHIIHC